MNKLIISVILFRKYNKILLVALVGDSLINEVFTAVYFKYTAVNVLQNI